MKKELLCKECQTNINSEYYCDECEKRLDIGGHFICEVGKPSIIEMERNGVIYHFCNYLCLLDFILKELRKERGN